MKKKHQTRKERSILRLIEQYRHEKHKPLVVPSIEQLHIERLKMNYEKEMVRRLQKAFAILTGQQASIVGDNLDALSGILSRPEVNSSYQPDSGHTDGRENVQIIEEAE